jgi:hypothetical protein
MILAFTSTSSTLRPITFTWPELLPQQRYCLSQLLIPLHPLIPPTHWFIRVSEIFRSLNPGSVKIVADENCQEVDQLLTDGMTYRTSEYLIQDFIDPRFHWPQGLSSGTIWSEAKYPIHKYPMPNITDLFTQPMTRTHAQVNYAARVDVK